MEAQTLSALAEQAEQASGPSRDLNIALLPLIGLRFVDEGHPIGEVCYDSAGRMALMPRFTSSLDAAMKLVPDGWHCGGLYDQFQTRRWHASIAQLPTERQLAAFDSGKTFGVQCEHGEAATGPLAICAAALRAHANIQSTKQEQAA